MNNLIIKNTTLNNYLKDFNNLSDIDKRYEFENIAGLFLKQHSVYGPNVYSSNSNQVPQNKQKEWNIVGLGIKGADWWCDSKMLGGAVPVEVKYQHDETKSLKMKKFGDKDKFLQKANIVEKVMITNVTSVSKFVEEYADDWTYIFGDDVWTPETYKRMRDVALAENKKQKISLKLPDIVSYRKSEAGPDKGSSEFHENSMRDGHIDVENQIEKYGNARTLWEKPTAAGKGYDPILYWNNFLKPYIISNNPKKKFFLTCTVNPQLTVLRGNAKKQKEQILASKSATKLRILASDNDEKQELNSVKTVAKVITQDQLHDEIENAINSKEYAHIHVETTIHSYYKLAEILTSLNIDKSDFLYIDEVKNTTQDKDSRYAMCLFDTNAKWLVRIGADANILELVDDKGNQLPTSMKNKKLWRSISVCWSEKDVTSRGWKRKTSPEVSVFDISNLHPSIVSLIENQKNGIIIKDKDAGGMIVNLEWRLSLETLAVKLINSNRKFPLIKVNTIKRAKSFEEYATKVWPTIVRQHGDSRNPKIKRLLNMPFLSIYREGNTHNKIISFVENIRTEYPEGANVIQVKKLNEGWDPTDGWVDSIQFIDASGSATLISQFVGRGARLDPLRIHMDLPVLMVKLIDSKNDLSIPYFFREVQSVCDRLGIGDNISESVIFHDYTNKGNPGSVKSKGSKNFRGIFAQGGFLEALKGFEKLGGRYNPYVSVVEEIFNTAKKTLYDAPFDMKSRIVLKDNIINNKDFKEYLQGHHQPAYHLTNIMKGRVMLLPYNQRREAKKLYNEYLQKVEQFEKNVLQEWKKEAATIAYPVTRPLGVLNAKGKYPVHILNTIKAKMLEDIPELTTVNELNRICRSSRDEFVPIWKSNFVEVCNNIISVLESKNVPFNDDDLAKAIDKKNLKYNTQPAIFFLNSFSVQNKQGSELRKTIKEFDANCYNNLKKAIEQYKAKRNKGARQAVWTDEIKDKIKKNTLDKNVTKILESNVIDILIKTEPNFRNTVDWVDNASKLSGLKSSYIKSKLWLVGNIFDEIPHKNKARLLESLKNIKFKSNSDIHKGKLSWNSGLGLKNGKEKCNTGIPKKVAETI